MRRCACIRVSCSDWLSFVKWIAAGGTLRTPSAPAHGTRAVLPASTVCTASSAGADEEAGDCSSTAKWEMSEVNIRV